MKKENVFWQNEFFYRFLMKPKHLISAFQELEGFGKPQLELEQYSTPPEIAAAILQHIAEDMGNLEDCMVADLGCGTGVLAIGCALLGGSFVLGMDIDAEALAICRRNMDGSGQSTSCELIQADLRAGTLPTRLLGQFDVVLTNPPFGTKNNQGADLEFVERGLKLIKTDGGKLFSLHKSSTRDFLLRKAKQWPEIRAECRAQLRWNLDKSYGFHRRKSADIDVDLFCFERV